jgi:response regulator RpfG family c-di-GMP phosphodiesterase
MNEIPSDVDIVVLQHHERPDGTGFPRGLHSHQISPLASVFIVAHDILDQILMLGEKFNLQEFLRRTEKEYDGHSFRKVWKALSQTSD